MTAELVTQALLTGTVDESEVPELHFGPLRDDVLQRLAAVGMDLFHSKAKKVFFAHPSSSLSLESLDGYRPHHRINDDARWVLSILWMFLVYLPELVTERVAAGVRDSALQLSELKIFVREAGMKINTLQLILGNLKRAGFVEGADVIREGYRMCALASWEMTANWDRCVQEFRRKEWFKQRYESYLADKQGESNSPEVAVRGQGSDAAD